MLLATLQEQPDEAIPVARHSTTGAFLVVFERFDGFFAGEWEALVAPRADDVIGVETASGMGEPFPAIDDLLRLGQLH